MPRLVPLNAYPACYDYGTDYKKKSLLRAAEYFVPNKGEPEWSRNSGKHLYRGHLLKARLGGAAENSFVQKRFCGFIKGSVFSKAKPDPNSGHAPTTSSGNGQRELDTGTRQQDVGMIKTEADSNSKMAGLSFGQTGGKDEKDGGAAEEEEGKPGRADAEEEMERGNGVEKETKEIRTSSVSANLTSAGSGNQGRSSAGSASAENNADKRTSIVNRNKGAEYSGMRPSKGGRGNRTGQPATRGSNDGQPMLNGSKDGQQMSGGSNDGQPAEGSLHSVGGTMEKNRKFLSFHDIQAEMREKRKSQLSSRGTREDYQDQRDTVKF